MNNFIQDCLAGAAKLDDIDDYIEKWHTTETTESLEEFLGMTHKEYGKWLLDGSDETLRAIIEAHRPNRPLFNADAAEEYFTDLCINYRDARNERFKLDNGSRPAENPIYSAEYQRLLGQELAIREVLDYFSKFDLGAPAEPKTRFDKIRASSTPEEMCVLLNTNEPHFCPHPGMTSQSRSSSCEIKKPCGQCITDWLREEGATQ